VARIAQSLSSAALLSLLAAAPALAGDLYFPPRGPEWKTVAPRQAGWDPEALDKALRLAGERRSTAVVILYEGRILAERYWDPGRPQPGGGLRANRYYFTLRGKDSAGRPIEDVASVQKSVLAQLVGIAQHRGLVKISDPVSLYLGRGWTKAPAGAEVQITIRHLLTMTSGLNEQLEFEAPAGAKWRYNTSAYARLAEVLEAVTHKHRNEFTREWLTRPIGMDDSQWIVRPWAQSRRTANRYGFATTARDLARFGLLILAGGRWRGKQVLPDPQYLRASLSPSQDLNPSYGYLWWLNGQPFSVRGTRRVPGPFIPTAPNDLVAALGALGRKLYVVPSLHLVVARLGKAPNVPGAKRFDTVFWRLLMAAAPGHKARWNHGFRLAPVPSPRNSSSVFSFAALEACSFATEARNPHPKSRDSAVKAGSR